MKILSVNQSSLLKTGYGVLSKKLLEHLSKKYEVAELACDIRSDDPRIANLSWKCWGNLPKNDQEKKEFEQNPLSMFGSNIFEEVCREYKPTHILSANDPWAASWIAEHPYKKYYNFVWMPTVDAEGLSKKWLYEFSLADKILTYQSWSSDVLVKESKKIHSLGNAPYIPEDYFPIKERNELKEKLGLSGFVIGTTMRNQARKRFPELFAAFKELLKIYPDTKLYCHCSYPDLQGWNIPQLLLNFEIAHKVYFSYICVNCKQIWPSTFKAVAFCPSCKQNSGITCNGNLSMDVKAMNIMYNCFDLYIQPVNAEGLGMPMLEAAATGTPILGTKYASLIDVISKLSGEFFDSELQQEITSDRWMASVSIKNMTEKLIEIRGKSNEEFEKWRIKTNNSFLENYKIEDSMKVWEEAINSCPKRSWDHPKQIFNIPQFNDKMMQMKNSDFVRWCILNILRDESKINTFFETKLISELDTRMRDGNKTPGLDKKAIFNELCRKQNWINYLEEIR